jgi:hypothetical protein
MLQQRRFWLPAILLAALALAAAPQPLARADSGTVTYAYLLGVVPIIEGPDVSQAPDGTTLTLTGGGTLSVHPDTVTGGGDFSTSDGQSGTWTALQLLSFVSYGTFPPPFPQELQGGQALIRIRLSTGADALLKINCTIGNAPEGKADEDDEGIRLAVQGGPNFNTPLSGQTVFILQ